MEERKNHRHFKEKYKTGEHLRLVNLRRAVCDANFDHRYLFERNIPAYPRPKFHVVRLKHDTGLDGLSGITEVNGFRNPMDKERKEHKEEKKKKKKKDKGNKEDKDLEAKILWWGLAVGPDEIASAERRLLETTYPDRTEEQKQRQESFLQQFATSPAFMRSSRLGSFRFTFSLQQVLGAYKEQFCDGAEPIMRVMKTALYKQEVIYVVLVHSPANTEQFTDLPLLTANPNSVCSYKDGGDGRDGYFLWRSEAMCCKHSFELVKDGDEKLLEANEIEEIKFYVWDNVALALYVDDQVLTFERDQLKEGLRYCVEGTPICIPKGADKESFFVDFEKAQQIVREMFDDFQYELQRA